MQSLPEEPERPEREPWFSCHQCLNYCFTVILSHPSGGPGHPLPREKPFLEIVRRIEMSELSSTPPPSREGSASERKAVLSEGQRKMNHNTSETKRRNRLRAWYWDLCQLIPELKDKAEENCKSERLVLDKTTVFARATMQRRNELIDALEAEGVDAGQELGLKVSMSN